MTHPIDALLDRVAPIGDDDESWSDKEWGVTYCTECAVEAEVVHETWYSTTYRCPVEECPHDTERKIDPLPATLAAVIAGGAASAVGASPPLAVLVAAIAYAASGFATRFLDVPADVERDDPAEAARDAYLRGEITEDELERRLAAHYHDGDNDGREKRVVER